MKPFVTVTMTLHGEVEKEVTDFVDNGGKFVPLGTEVLAMLERHEVVHYKDESGVETIIPFDSVMTYNTTKESQEYTKPEDAFCVSEGGETNTDCEQTDLGELYYCGGLQNGNIINDETSTHDAGAIVTDTVPWQEAIQNAATVDPNDHKDMYLVSNGNSVLATMASDNSVAFGNVGLSWEVDAETSYGRAEITNAPTHYAIYSKHNPN